MPNLEPGVLHLSPDSPGVGSTESSNSHEGILHSHDSSSPTIAFTPNMAGRLSHLQILRA